METVGVQRYGKRGVPKPCEKSGNILEEIMSQGQSEKSWPFGPEVGKGMGSERIWKKAFYRDCHLCSVFITIYCVSSTVIFDLWSVLQSLLLVYGVCVNYFFAIEKMRFQDFQTTEQ